MATYIQLLNLTEQGIRNIKEAPERLRRAERLAQELGARITGFYLTMGTHDYVAIVEAPDDETMARFALVIGSQGNVRTTTLKAFSREEFERIARSLG